MTALKLIKDTWTDCDGQFFGDWSAYSDAELANELKENDKDIRRILHADGSLFLQSEAAIINDISPELIAADQKDDWTEMDELIRTHLPKIFGTPIQRQLERLVVKWQIKVGIIKETAARRLRSQLRLV